MYIGIKDGHILIFSDSEDGVRTNAAMRGIFLDAIEWTTENIVPYYNTPVDGRYFKESEVPPTPVAVVNEQRRERRQEEYALHCDSLTAQISVLKDSITQGDHGDEAAKNAVEEEIAKLHSERKEIRARIVERFPYL
jgi:hypothetical protein